MPTTQRLVAASEEPERLEIFKAFIAAKGNMPLGALPGQLLDAVALWLLGLLEGDAAPRFDAAWLGNLPEGGHDDVLRDMLGWAGSTPLESRERALALAFAFWAQTVLPHTQLSIFVTNIF